jgi:predicted DNA-binding mobile mystery protein A
MKARRAADASGGGNGAPPDGWIRTMRQARGISLRQLGTKLGIKGNSVHVAERREMEGGISLYQLRRIAQALECDLFYAFVPRQGAMRPAQRYAAALQARAEAEGAAALVGTVVPGPLADKSAARPAAEK